VGVMLLLRRSGIGNISSDTVCDNIAQFGTYSIHGVLCCGIGAGGESQCVEKG